MKKIIAVILIVSGIIGTFCACSNNNNDDVPAKLDNITSGYTGDVKVGQSIKTQKLDIVLGKYIFTINDVRYRFKDFEKSPKRTTKLGDYKMDIYVENSTLQKCILRQSNEYGRTVYSAVFAPDGTATDYYKYTCDDFGNITCRMHYDKDGKLESFLTAEYDEKTQNQTAKYLYNANYSLNEVIKYNYNDNGKLISTSYYDNKGNLTKTVNE